MSLKISKWVIRQRTEKAFLWDIWREDYEHNKVKATVDKAVFFTSIWTKNILIEKLENYLMNIF